MGMPSAALRSALRPDAERYQESRCPVFDLKQSVVVKVVVVVVGVDDQIDIPDVLQRVVIVVGKAVAEKGNRGDPVAQHGVDENGLAGRFQA